MQTARIISLNDRKRRLHLVCSEQFSDQPLLRALLRDRLSRLNLREEVETIFADILKIDLGSACMIFSQADVERFPKRMNRREATLLHEHLKSCLGKSYVESRARIAIALIFDFPEDKGKPTKTLDWQIHGLLRIYDTVRALCSGCRFNPRNPGQSYGKC